VVVGVVGDERHVGPARAPDANVYIPAYQYGWTSRLSIAARAAGSTDAALSRLRSVAREIDRSLAPYEVRLMSDMAVEVLATERFLTLLLVVFAMAALAGSSRFSNGRLPLAVRVSQIAQVNRVLDDSCATA
jgi:hypothetical protein